eukprot:scaffold37714_cov248-Skeletonema_marinoi.AAC.4
MKKTMKSPASHSRRTPARRRGYHPSDSLGRGVNKMSLNDLLTGTPNKRSSQTFVGTNTRRDHVPDLAQSGRTSNEGRSDEMTQHRLCTHQRRFIRREPPEQPTSPPRKKQPVQKQMDRSVLCQMGQIFLMMKKRDILD